MIIPKFKVKYKEELELADGAELHLLTRDGKDSVVALYSVRKKKFIRIGE